MKARLFVLAAILSLLIPATQLSSARAVGPMQAIYPPTWVFIFPPSIEAGKIGVQINSTQLATSIDYDYLGGRPVDNYVVTLFPSVADAERASRQSGMGGCVGFQPAHPVLLDELGCMFGSGTNNGVHIVGRYRNLILAASIDSQAGTPTAYTIPEAVARIHVFARAFLNRARGYAAHASANAVMPVVPGSPPIKPQSTPPAVPVVTAGTQADVRTFVSDVNQLLQTCVAAIGMEKDALRSLTKSLQVGGTDDGSLATDEQLALGACGMSRGRLETLLIPASLHADANVHSIIAEVDDEIGDLLDEIAAILQIGTGEDMGSVALINDSINHASQAMKAAEAHDNVAAGYLRQLTREYHL